MSTQPQFSLSMQTNKSSTPLADIHRLLCCAHLTKSSNFKPTFVTIIGSPNSCKNVGRYVSIAENTKTQVVCFGICFIANP